MGGKKLERALKNAFRCYGNTVGEHPAPFLLIPLIISAMVAPGLLLMKNDDDVNMLFTPYKAPSRREVDDYLAFSYMKPMEKNETKDEEANGIIDPYYLPLLSESKRYLIIPWHIQVTSDNESTNLMTENVWTVLTDLTRYLYENFTCDSVGVDGVSRTFKYNPDFCDTHKGCARIDEPVSKVRQFLHLKQRQKPGSDNGVIRLTYPVMYVFNQPFNWGQYVRGVTVDNETQELLSAYYLSFFLQFQYDNENEVRVKANYDCMKSMTDYVIAFKDDRAPALRFYPNYERRINENIEMAKTVTLPYLAMEIILITSFATLSSLKRGAFAFTALEAFIGVLAIGLSIMTNYGLLFFCGLHLNFVVILTPFLVLCVGIDNDFLLIASWRKYAGDPVARRRLGFAFADAGPSLAITSMNDILCFAIGYMSELPAVANFCAYTCVALIVRFFYQMTFFAAVLAYVGRMESRRRKVNSDPEANGCAGAEPCWDATEKTDSKEHIEKACAQDSFYLREAANQRCSLDFKVSKFFRDHYAPLIMRPWFKVFTMIVYSIYTVFSLYFTSRLIIDIRPVKLFIDGSPMVKTFQIAEKFQYTDAIVGHVFVNSPPDFRNATNIERFLRFVGELEDPPYKQFISPAQHTTTLWLRDYATYVSYTTTDSQTDYNEDFYMYMATFLSSPDNARYTFDLRFSVEDAPEVAGNATAPYRDIELRKFHFTIFYRNVNSWDDRLRLLLFWRETCANYSDYDASVFDEAYTSSYLDQRRTLAPATLQTSGIALLTMSVVVAVFMPNFGSCFFICLTFLTVDTGVVALLKVWNVEMDAMLMTGILMTIGFSVYYTARVCYCYQTAGKDLKPTEKVAETLGAIGWPILQGGIATLLGALPLGLVPSYMVRVIFKTITLVVIVGLAHGLWLVPVLMTIFDRWTCRRMIRCKMAQIRAGFCATKEKF